MPLRRRLSLTVAVVALLVVVAAGAAAWLTTRSVLRGNVDDSLRAQAAFATRVPRFRVPGGITSASGSDLQGMLRVPGPPPGQGGPSEYQQFLTGDGQIVPRTEDDVELPVQGADRVVVTGGGATSPRDVEVGGAHLRMVTVPVSLENRLLYRSRLGVDVAAVQFARSMTGVDSALRTLWVVLLALGVVIVATAALLARATARRVLRPVTDLAAAAAHVEANADLGGRLPVRSQDEVGELTRRFNGMLARLQGSREELDRSMVEQRNLVADASHELRTPVTSLRTNAEVLLEDDESLSPQERRGILADVRDQAEDLGLLVADLIELARGDAPDRGADEPVALDALVEECVGRARRDHRGVTFATTLQPVVVAGRPDRLARAISNLVNNAALHGADGSGAVEVLVSAEAGDPARVGEQRVSRARPEATRTGDVEGADGQAAVGRAREGRSAEGRPADAPPSGAPLRPAGAAASGGALWAGGAGRDGGASSAGHRGGATVAGTAAGAATSASTSGAPTDGAVAVLRIVDHGPGVPPEDRARIFDRFRRGDTVRGRHGSGLGLAIVRQVASVHGGTVDVEDTPGGGATFVLRLPAVTD